MSPLELMLYLLCAGVGITPTLVIAAILMNLTANNVIKTKAAQE